MEKKNTILRLVLTLITCGFYGIYWMYQMNEDLKQLRGGESATAEGGRLVLYTFLSCGLYSVYWMYVNSDVLGQLREERGMEPDGASKENYIISSILAVVVSVGVCSLLAAILVITLLVLEDSLDQELMFQAFGESAGRAIGALFRGITVLIVMVALTCRRQPGDSPRLLTIFSAIVFIMQCFPPFLSLGFMQKSLNELIDRLQKEGDVNL